MLIGALVVSFSALLLAWLVYAIYIGIKGNSNLRIAKEMYAKSNEYCMTQEECKAEMKKVDAHLREATVEVNNFETILEEHASTLKRVIYVEGVYDEDKEYHPSSKKAMRETEKILKSIEKLLNTAITKKGKLNVQSVEALAEARAVYAEYLGRIYD
jgi:site-specific DNA-adenine methylase